MGGAGLKTLVDLTTLGFEMAGIAVIVAGTLASFWRYARRLAAGRRSGVYRGLRSDLGRSILLGLELLVAADIINTVAIEPTLGSLAVLAGIVLIRTFLSWALEVEIDGRWPWQSGRGDGPGSD